MLAVVEGGQVHCESEIMPIVGDEPIKAFNLAISQNLISLSLHASTNAHKCSSKHWLV